MKQRGSKVRRAWCVFLFTAAGALHPRRLHERRPCCTSPAYPRSAFRSPYDSARARRRDRALPWAPPAQHRALERRRVSRIQWRLVRSRRAGAPSSLHHVVVLSFDAMPHRWNRTRWRSSLVYNASSQSVVPLRTLATGQGIRSLSCFGTSSCAAVTAGGVNTASHISFSSRRRHSWSTPLAIPWSKK